MGFDLISCRSALKEQTYIYYTFNIQIYLEFNAFYATLRIKLNSYLLYLFFNNKFNYLTPVTYSNNIIYFENYSYAFSQTSHKKSTKRRPPLKCSHNFHNIRLLLFSSQQFHKYLTYKRLSLIWVHKTFTKVKLHLLTSQNFHK